ALPRAHRDLLGERNTEGGEPHRPAAARADRVRDAGGDPRHPRWLLSGAMVGHQGRVRGHEGWIPPRCSPDPPRRRPPPLPWRGLRAGVEHLPRQHDARVRDPGVGRRPGPSAGLRTAAEIRGRPEAADAGRVLPLAAGTRLVQRRRIHRADAAARHGVQCPRRLRRGLPRQEAGARMAMKILVTGSDGYIGARMVPRLLAAGHEVTGLDTGLYRDGWLYSEQHGQPVLARTLNMDLRRVEPRQLEGFDAVVHLAELSNDPLGQNDPQVTRQINLEGSVRLARAARRAGVGRFVYAPSCRVYGP